MLEAGSKRYENTPLTVFGPWDMIIPEYARSRMRKKHQKNYCQMALIPSITKYGFLRPNGQIVALHMHRECTTLRVPPWHSTILLTILCQCMLLYIRSP